jgi:uncharacterized protein involved in high-affinity Fe2+ transport
LGRSVDASDDIHLDAGIHTHKEANMRGHISHTLVTGLLVALSLSAGCAAEQLERFRDTMKVAMDTTREAINTVEEVAKTVQCVKDKTCPEN